MRLVFSDVLGLNYKRPSQHIRVLSESWMKSEMYCPSCGNDHLTQFPNNSRLADFFCGQCGEIYELKSKGSPIGKTILDGAYYAALERIFSSTNPNLFVLHYKQNSVEDLTLVPKHFFTPDILIKRKALSPNARRAGYVGSLIMYEDIPAHGFRLRTDNMNLPIAAIFEEQRIYRVSGRRNVQKDFLCLIGT